MTTGNWVDLLIGSQSNSMASFAVLLTMISGYMVVAYTAGKKLTRLQLYIGTILYLAASLFVVLGMRSSMIDAAKAKYHLSSLSQDLLTDVSLESHLRIVEIVFSVDVLLVLAPLIIMWQVRQR